MSSTKQKNYEALFEPGDSVRYEHPVYGGGFGVVVAYNDRTKDFVVYPNKAIKGIEYIICDPEKLISTPF